ncbi:MAG: hypothetical protein J5903_01435, partial [Clostridia bacterium]|nr:hypothetical protein [Clostridia bacterium]
MLGDYLEFGDLGEEFVSLSESVRGGIPSAVFGVTFSEKCHLAAGLSAPVLYIVKDPIYGRKVAEETEALTGKETVFLPAKDDVLLYKTAFDKAGLFSRLDALCKIKKGARTIVTTFEALLQLFPKELPVLTFKKGCEYDLYEIADRLVSLGYRREEFAEDKGVFAIRGDIFEIYPVNGDKIYRVDFFGDEAES